MINKPLVVLLTAIFLAPFVAKADEYHYRNILIGERASGLGGAFTALSDDPTGVYYNPAGLVFGFENYISVSANTYNSSRIQYKDIVPGQNYSLSSDGLIPTFFGFSQNFGKQKIAFTVIVPNSDRINQDDSLTNLFSEADAANTIKRKFFRQDTTYLIGPGYALEMNKTTSLGISLLGFARLDDAIDNQLIIYNNGRYFTQNTYLKQRAYGIIPKIGVQVMATSNISVGLTASKPLNLGGSGSMRVLKSKNVVQDGTYTHDLDEQEGSVKPWLAAPLNISLGAAYFPSKSFLVSADFDYYSKDTGAPANHTPIVATFNAAAGVEWFPNEGLALRFGGFTNRANTPEVVKGGMDQAEHVNLYGGSFGISFIKSGSSFSLGSNYTWGKGQGQAIGGSTWIQDVTQSSLSFSLSGTYQL